MTLTTQMWKDETDWLQLKSVINIDKSKSLIQAQPQIKKKSKPRTMDFWPVTKISWATTPTFKLKEASNKKKTQRVKVTPSSLYLPSKCRWTKKGVVKVSGSIGNIELSPVHRESPNSWACPCRLRLVISNNCNTRFNRPHKLLNID